MKTDKALELLHSKMQNQNLRRHCYAVSAVMGALYDRLVDGVGSKEDKEKWKVVGLLHDGDYEVTKGTPELHTLKMAEWLTKEGVKDKEILDAILSHNYAHTGQNPPKNNLEWSLYCSDELTGLIVAVALVKDAKLSNVTVDSVESKWNKTGFAGGVDRKQIEQCQERLGIPLREFIEISITAMQSVHEELGL